LIPDKDELLKMEKHIGEAQKIIYRLNSGALSIGQFNTALDGAAQQFELTAVEVRRLCEKNKIGLRLDTLPLKAYHNREIFGEVELTDEGWIHIRLKTLLPSGRGIENSAYISDSITRLLDNFTKRGGELPFFDKAFLAIIERCDFENRKSFDHDNKGFKCVQNALKGRLFADDNQFELSLGLFTEFDPECACHIWCLPENEVVDFLYQRQTGEI